MRPLKLNSVVSPLIFNSNILVRVSGSNFAFVKWTSKMCCNLTSSIDALFDRICPSAWSPSNGNLWFGAYFKMFCTMQVARSLLCTKIRLVYIYVRRVFLVYLYLSLHPFDNFNWTGVIELHCPIKLLKSTCSTQSVFSWIDRKFANSAKIGDISNESKLKVCFDFLYLDELMIVR